MDTRAYFKRSNGLRRGGYDVAPSQLKMRVGEENQGLPLFHYTNFDAFVNILQSKKIRATNALHMNDAEELSFAANFLIDVVVDNAPADLKERIFLFLFEGVSRNLPSQQYIFSLSKAGSLLSQWRAYAHPTGLSFGWNSVHLEKIAAATGGRVVDVHYSVDAQLAAISPLAKRILDEFQPSWAESDLSADGVFRERFFEEFSQVAPSLKHIAFHEERETRIVWDNSSGAYPVKYQGRENDIKPWIEVDFSECPEFKKLDTIMIGTSFQYLKKFAELDRIIEGLEYEYRCMAYSDIPYQRL